MSPRFATLALLLALAVACSGGSGGSSGPVPLDSTATDSSLRFLRPAVTAPAFAERTVSFWAVKGQRREIRLMYQPAIGQIDSVEFVRFRVDNTTLIQDSTGNPLANGDSVLITLTISDTLRLITDFRPSGLIFNPKQPARLWIKFGEADPDLNHDGLVTAADTTLLLGLTIWKQEHPTDTSWTLLSSVVNTVTQEVEADVFGFTRYAVAY